ncbi:hypothetical protein ACFQV4_34245 [Streptomyces thermocarboxydus]
MRRDRDEWIVGRMATRTFVALPPAGARAVRLLGEGLSVARTQERLRADTGEEFDIADFVTDLAALGFVARIDGRPLPDPAPPRASLPWLRPRHVRFALHPVLPVAVAVLLTAALVTMLLRPGLLPGYRDLLWSPHGSVVLLSGRRPDGRCCSPTNWPIWSPPAPPGCRAGCGSAPGCSSSSCRPTSAASNSPRAATG